LEEAPLVTLDDLRLALHPIFYDVNTPLLLRSIFFSSAGEMGRSESEWGGRIDQNGLE
jgi:hypothetical protein